MCFGGFVRKKLWKSWVKEQVGAISGQVRSNAVTGHRSRDGMRTRKADVTGRCRL